MGAPGITVASLASDGDWIYLRLNQEKRFYKKRSGRGLFKKMVHIPVTIQDMVQVLGGKIPLMPHGSAALIDNDSGHPTYALELKDKWGRVSQRIFFSSDTDHPLGFERLETDGSVSYRVEFREMINLEQYRLPRYLVVSGAKGESFELSVDKYWLNQPLPSSRFILNPQK